MIAEVRVLEERVQDLINKYVIYIHTVTHSQFDGMGQRID